MTAPARPAASEHIAALTGLRAYAAIWVMLMHLQFGVGIKPHIQLGTIIAHGYWAVDVFFMLSGFLLSMLYARRFEHRCAARDYVPYLAARFARIYPLHLFTLLLLLGAVVLHTGGQGPGKHGPGFSLTYLALNVLLLHAWGLTDRLNWNYPSWSISAEWFAYLLLLPLLARGLRRVPPATVFGLGLLLWTGAWALIHAQGQHVGEQAVTLGALARITAEFSLGYALHRLIAGRQLRPRTGDALCFGAIGAIVVLCHLPLELDLLLAPCVAVLLAGLVSGGRWTGAVFGHRWAVFWGERSYSIYMLHAVVQILCGLLLQHLGVGATGAGQAWALYVLQVAAVLLFSHWAYEWLELPLRVQLRDALVSRLLRAPARKDQPA